MKDLLNRISERGELNLYRTDKYNVELVFNMENGLYVFDNQSATGKTRLCKEIREHQK